MKCWKYEVKGAATKNCKSLTDFHGVTLAVHLHSD